MVTVKNASPSPIPPWKLDPGGGINRWTTAPALFVLLGGHGFEEVGR